MWLMPQQLYLQLLGAIFGPPFFKTSGYFILTSCSGLCHCRRDKDCLENDFLLSQYWSCTVVQSLVFKFSYFFPLSSFCAIYLWNDLSLTCHIRWAAFRCHNFLLVISMCATCVCGASICIFSYKCNFHWQVTLIKFKFNYMLHEVCFKVSILSQLKHAFIKTLAESLLNRTI